MTNNNYANWKIATVFLCIASFTSSAFCAKRPYEVIAQKVIDATYAIEAPEDAQKVLNALADIDQKEAISAIVKLASFFSQGSGAFYSFGPFTMEFDDELKARTTLGTILGLDQQVYLLSAAMLDERYKDYWKDLTHLKSLQGQSLLLHMVGFCISPEIIAQLIPIYKTADRLDTRSNEGFNALSLAVINLLLRESSCRKQLVLDLIHGGASLDGPINYQNTATIKSYLEMLEILDPADVASAAGAA